jgi:hypothetical protein
MLLADAITAVSAQFDTSTSATSDTVIRSWIHRCVREAVAQAKWRKVRRELGTTTAALATYELDEDIVQVLKLRVDGSRWWHKATMEEMVDLETSNGRLYDSPGAWSQEFEALAQDGVESPADGDTSLVRLWPAPETSGLAITALCAVQSVAITSATTAGTFEIGVPDDLAGPVAVDGPIAMGFREALGRHEDAAQYQARYELGKNELARRANSRASGGAIFVRPGRR